MVKQAKRQSKANAPRYKYGVHVSRNEKHAMELDAANGNTLWQAGMDRELDEINKFDTFSDRGKKTDGLIQSLRDDGYKWIRLHWVFDVKPDLRRKARLVANGALTSPNIDGTYSSVVSLRALRMCLLLGELNGLEVKVGDVSNAYLMAKTKEKVFFVAGPEFGELAGHVMVVYKALYGLRCSGAAYHAFFADTMHQMGFKPSYADPDVWLRDAGDCYEYVCCYVDDLACVMKNPQAFFDELKDRGYLLKGAGDPDIHLGGNSARDPDGTLSLGAKKYIQRMSDNYNKVHGELPPKQSSPMQKDDHPELDTSPELDDEGIRLYQSLIGCFQWCITLGRFDIMVATVTLSRFRPAPREGHLE